MRRRLAFCIIALVALDAAPSAACEADDDSGFGFSDVSGELLPQRCADRDRCRIFDLSGRELGAVGDQQVAETKSQGLIGFRSAASGLQGFMDAAGAVVIAPKYARVKPFCDGLAAVELPTRKWIHIDRGGRQVGDQWDDAESFTDGVATVSVLTSQARPGKSVWMHGYVDPSGKLVIPTRWPGGTRPFSEGRAAVQLDGEKWGYVDHDGRTVIAPRFETASRFRAGRAVATLDGVRFGLIDETGKFVIAPTHASISKLEGADVWRVNDEDPTQHGDEERPLLTRLFGRDGRPLSDDVFDRVSDVSENSIAACRLDGMCGYLDASAKAWAIPARFKGAESFAQGLAAATLDGKVWGFIGVDGEFVIAPRFDAQGPTTEADTVGPFAQGLAPAGCKGRWGFIDRQGAWAVRPLYRMTQGFHDGFGTVALASGEAHIRADGTPIDFAASEIDTAPVDEAPCGAPLAAGAK
ncbi:MAG: WG repeat-containing protein [Rhodoblastus sp.]|nr:WG repeat-containing protein [Rhodoblastus sp.]